MPPDWIVSWLIHSPFKTVLIAADDCYEWLQTAKETVPDTSFHIIAKTVEDRADWLLKLDGTYATSVLASQVLGGQMPTTIDEYAKAAGIRHLHLLKIGQGADVMGMLSGAERLLRHARIDFIRFTFEETGAYPIEQIIELLAARDFEFVASNAGATMLVDPEMIPAIRPGSEITAAHRRYLGVLNPDSSRALHTLFDIGEMTRRYNIPVRGIIHIGAHRGAETAEYLKLGADHILMIEANPALAALLSDMTMDIAEIRVAHCAITDMDGPIDFHLIKNDQCSSILAPTDIGRRMPQMDEIGIVQVPGRRLDRLLEEESLDAGDFNILNIDIQGAELHALRGAEATLRSIDAINIEVNFLEHYEGCAQIDEIDDHLEARGFKRISISTPYDATWGDAFYVRERLM